MPLDSEMKESEYVACEAAIIKNLYCSPKKKAYERRSINIHVIDQFFTVQA